MFSDEHPERDFDRCLDHGLRAAVLYEVADMLSEQSKGVPTAGVIAVRESASNHHHLANAAWIWWTDR